MEGQKREGQESFAKEGRILVLNGRVYERVKRLNWTPLFQRFRNIPKLSHLGDMKDAKEKRHQHSKLLGSVMNYTCIVIL